MQQEIKAEMELQLEQKREVEKINKKLRVTESEL